MALAASDVTPATPLDLYVLLGECVLGLVNFNPEECMLVHVVKPAGRKSAPAPVVPTALTFVEGTAEETLTAEITQRAGLPGAPGTRRLGDPCSLRHIVLVDAAGTLAVAAAAAAPEPEPTPEHKGKGGGGGAAGADELLQTICNAVAAWWDSVEKPPESSNPFIRRVTPAPKQPRLYAVRGGLAALLDEYPFLFFNTPSADPAAADASSPAAASAGKHRPPVPTPRLEVFPSQVWRSPPEEGGGRVYLGAREHAANGHMLRAMAVTHVVNATPDLADTLLAEPFSSPPSPSSPLPCKYHRVAVEDQPSAVLLDPHFGEVSEFLEAAVAGGGCVFVHCHQGISRSASLVAAWLMSKRGFPSRDAAIAHLVKRRWLVSPNSGFRAQLLEWQGRVCEAPRA